MKFTAEQIVLEGEVIGNPMLKYMCCPRLKKERKVLIIKPKIQIHHIYSTEATITIVNKTLYQSQH
jgi:hypothetical protein